ncbi:hypothetical protein ADK75_00785 [Streptomyces virginiae]|uniref:Uncharacterized protein n=1 Tax=Streptomyces virginiae TaxID=1961 RepID=A0A0L8N632_STRVG|nr:hypothetical protein [Streptomyces virginiae]KOG57970.1 hypothetical protein ADK75_00785 [Streptomyces virginiae]
MTLNNELRLLPWSGPDGKPCFLSSDDATSFLSRLADNAEENQLGSGAKILDQALTVLTEPVMDPEELRLLVGDLTRALHDAIRVATSRGRRLPYPARQAPGVQGSYVPAPPS